MLIGVRQHASTWLGVSRPSLRFPSVLLQPLGHLSTLESTNCGRSDVRLSHVGSEFLGFCDGIWIQRFTAAASRIGRGNCVRPRNLLRSLRAIWSEHLYNAGILAANTSMRGVEVCRAQVMSPLPWFPTRSFARLPRSSSTAAGRQQVPSARPQCGRRPWNRAHLAPRSTRRRRSVRDRSSTLAGRRRRRLESLRIAFTVCNRTRIPDVPVIGQGDWRGARTLASQQSDIA